MDASEESDAIWAGFGRLLQTLQAPENRVAATFIRVLPVPPDDPDNVKSPSDGIERSVPLITIADLLNKDYESTVELLVAARLVKWHRGGPAKTAKLVVNKLRWDQLQAMFNLDSAIVPQQVTHNKYLGHKIMVIRIGSYSEGHAKFTAIDQATRCFESAGRGQRLRIEKWIKEFHELTSSELIRFKAIEEAKNKKPSPEEDPRPEDRVPTAPAVMNEDHSKPAAVPLVALAKPSDANMLKTGEAKFNVCKAHNNPIRYKLSNGREQVAVRIPKSSSRRSFRSNAKDTHWVDNIVANMTDYGKASKDESSEWLMEYLAEQNEASFRRVARRKGFLLPESLGCHPGIQQLPGLKNPMQRRQLQGQFKDTCVNGSKGHC